MITDHDLQVVGPQRADLPSRTEGSRTRRPVLFVIAFGAFSLLLLGLVVASRSDPTPAFQGAVLGTPWEKPPIVLSDTEGEPFDLQARTEGQVTLLFFGYLNCPDICPAHLMNISSALEVLPNEVAGRVAMVFVTTDPERDDPAAIRAFLDRFDRRFVGLWGTTEEVLEAQQQAGVATAVADPVGADGEYEVGHAAQVIAYGPDGLAHVVYPFGTRQSDWLHDLPLLVEGEHP